MSALDHAQHILENMLGYLGFAAQVEQDATAPEGPTLHIMTEEADPILGQRGELLDDYQYLVNRLLITHLPDAPRIRVDCNFHRSMREDRMLEKAKELAQRVITTGQPARLPPMNSYYRRLIHHAFEQDPKIATESAAGSERFKSITLRLK
jgi:spoIIIJ-associated protein